MRDDNSKDKAVISRALQCMTDCARHINEMKRSHEDTMKIQEIQSILYNFEGFNLHDFGKLVIEVRHQSSISQMSYQYDSSY